MDRLSKYPTEQLPCVYLDPDLWFSTIPEDERHAADYCLLCPARLDCLADALDAEAKGVVPIGMRGGVTAKKRKKMGRRRWTETP